MNTRKERLNEVYEHLRKHHAIHTKTEFADAIQVKRPGLYSAMNGNEAYLTDSLFKRICAAFQGVFNLNYLLTGEGVLLTIEEEVNCDEIEKFFGKAVPVQNPTADLVDLCARVIKEVEYLRKQLTEEIAEVHTLRMELSATLHQLRGQYKSPNLPTASAAETTTK